MTMRGDVAPGAVVPGQVVPDDVARTDVVPDRARAAAPDGDAVRTARWVASLIGAIVLLQRFAVPGTAVALLVPVLLLWGALAMMHRVVVVNPTRLVLFTAAVAVTGATMLLQGPWVPQRQVSLGSWALVLVTSAPFVLQLVDRRVTTYVLVLRHLVRWGTGIAVVCLVMTLSQVAGLRYRDWFAAVVPRSVQLDGFAISYPYSYGSSLYRANAWIGLEPSFVSFQLGLAIVAALLVRRSLLTVAVLAAAMVTTASGTGMLLVAVAVVVILAGPRRRVLLPYAPAAVIALVVLASTPFGLNLIGRAGELDTSNSSASLRFSQPYAVLWRPWSGSVGTALWGDGPGSSQQLISDTHVDGLLVPTVAKIFFDYGLVGGVVLAAFLVGCYVGGLSRTFALALFVSLWTIQPGLTTAVLVAPVVALVSLWSPRRGLQVEDVPARAGASTSGDVIRS